LVAEFDFFGFVGMVVLGPFFHLKSGNLPRGVRKVETQLQDEDFHDLLLTIPAYTKQSLIDSLVASVTLYRKLRKSLFDNAVQLQSAAENRVMKYFEEFKQQAGLSKH
jgi:hypothetical protein